MAKGKNRGGGCGGGGEEDTKKDDNGSGGAFLNIVLKVDFHCDGCTEKIRKHLSKFPGVLQVEFEGDNKVKIMAQKTVDPVKLRERVQKKTLKKIDIVSPQPSEKDDKNKDNNRDNKPKEPAVSTVMLKVAYHCQGCGDKLYKAISSYKGVHEVSIEKEKDRVKVTGRIEDQKKTVEDLKMKLKKPVEIVTEKKDKEKKDQRNGEKEKEKEKGNGGEKKEAKMEYLVNGSGYVGICDGSGRVLEIFDTPQLFSDDNPNACSLM